MHILITGAAGFIGSALAHRLLERGDQVTGLDNLNEYYDVRLKEARLARVAAQLKFGFVRLDITDRAAMTGLFKQHRFDAVVHLAAQAGVRYSIENPSAYVDANLGGFCNLLQSCRHTGTRHPLFPPSSSSSPPPPPPPFSPHD